MHIARKDLPKELSRMFPEYRGTRFKIIKSSRVTICELQMRNGTGRTWRYSCGTGNSVTLKNGADYKIHGDEIFACHEFYKWKDKGITFYVAPFSKWVPEQLVETLSGSEMAVLTVTKHYSSEKRWEQLHWEFGMGRVEYDDTVKVLISKGLLAKNKSLTPKGRNYVR